jgi:hypothetical protein
MMPERVQIRRDRPWQRDPKAIKVDRTTKWGNIWRVGDPYPWADRPMSRADAVEVYKYQIEGAHEFFAQVRRELAGKDLACWCPLDEPCHADVLLLIANSTGGPHG